MQTCNACVIDTTDITNLTLTYRHVHQAGEKLKTGLRENGKQFFQASHIHNFT